MTKTMTTGKAALALAAAALASAAVLGLAAQPAQAAAVKAPKVSSITVSGDVDKATVTVKVGKCKHNKTKKLQYSSTVKLTLPNGKAKTATVSSKTHKATFKKVKLGYEKKVTAKARNIAEPVKASGMSSISDWSASKSAYTATRTPGTVKLTGATQWGAGYVKLTLSKASLATSYQVQAADNASFKGAKSTTVSSSGTTDRVQAASADGTNHVRARAIRTVNGKSAYGAWSSVSTCSLKAHECSFTVPVKGTVKKASGCWKVIHRHCETTYYSVCEPIYGQDYMRISDASLHYCTLCHGSSGNDEWIENVRPAVTGIVGYRCETCGKIEYAEGL